MTGPGARESADSKRPRSRARQVAAYLGWPDGSVEVVERVAARWPGWQVGWRPALSDRPARFYAARQDDPGALPVLLFGQDEAELVAAIEARDAVEDPGRAQRRCE